MAPCDKARLRNSSDVLVRLVKGRVAGCGMLMMKESLEIC
jgi:hypothetical protein